MGVSKRLYMGVSTHTYDDVLTHLHTCVLQRRPLIVAERQHIAHGKPAKSDLTSQGSQLKCRVYELVLILCRYYLLNRVFEESPKRFISFSVQSVYNAQRVNNAQLNAQRVNNS